MAYKHGVYVSEIPAAVTSPIVSDTFPVVFGTAPIHLSNREKPPVNEPVLCNTYGEAVEAFGYSDDWNYTLSEFIYSQFVLYGVSPVILVNVLDPDKHTTSVIDQEVLISDGLATVIDHGVLKPTVVVGSEDGITTYEKDLDYSIGFNSKGELLIQILAGGTIGNATKLKVSFDKLDPTLVTAEDIIGGIDSITGKATGLELLDEVFPRYRMVPGIIAAPGYSHEPEVGLVMAAKATNINGLFSAIALTDVPANIPYTDVPAWKEDNGYTSSYQIVGYSKPTIADKKFHFSTMLTGVLCATDARNGGVPYISPSNQQLQATGSVLDDGTPVYLGPEQAAFLNGNGIVTALNFIGGWKAWGNRTGAYPSVSDPKDAFIPVRRMFSWISNTIILSTWQRIDAPITRRLVEAITDSLNLWFNGLTAQGYILGGRVEFNASENPEIDILEGKIKFHVYVTPPSPAREINFMVEYDAGYLGSLFG